jgi:quercetin dioxygenase-like cupin family protein
MNDSSAADRRRLTVSDFPLIKNVPFSETLVLTDLVDYQEGRVVSRTFVQNKLISFTLFAFDKGEGLSAHTAAGDAFVQILDGEALINIGGKDFVVKTGEVVVMPANVSHSLEARERFKMLLTVIKGGA